MIWNKNREGQFTADCFSGMVKALPHLWQCPLAEKNSSVLVKAKPTLEHFAVIISGGGGNGPLFPGYVADGLADAAAVGAPYAAPNAYAIYEAGKMLGQEKGVLLLYNNFAGDYLNNDMAQDFLRMENIPVETVISNDDIGTALGEPRENRGGRVGIALLIKLAGSCAKRGYSLEEAAACLRSANERLGTVSLHVDFEKQELVIGGGFSGEPGIMTSKNLDMTNAVHEAVRMLVLDLQLQKGDKLFLLVNRLRFTSYPDSYMAANIAYDYLSQDYNVQAMRVGGFSNIMDAYGMDFSILVMDEEVASLMDTTVQTDAFII